MGYLSLAAFAFILFNYYRLASNNSTLNTQITECNKNITHLSDLLIDESKEVIIYDKTYHKCIISEYIYNKCFGLLLSMIK